MPNFLSKDFEQLRRIYSFIKENNDERQLITSKYYQNNILLEDFQIKFFINQFGDSLRLILPLIRNEDIRRFIEGLANKEERDAFFEFEYMLRENDIIQIVDLFEQHTVDEIYTIIKETSSNLNELITNGKALNIDPLNFALLVFCQNIIPEKDKPYIQNILKTSPSVIEFMINSYHVSPVIMIKIIRNHMTNESLRFKKQLYELMLKNNSDMSQLSSLGFNDPYKINELITAEFGDSPIITIIKILFANDLLKGIIRYSDISPELYEYAIPLNISGSGIE